MSPAPKPVADLLAERAKYTQWLAQLETRTAGAPAHVVAKVRSDYDARLSAVREALSERASELAHQRTEALAARDGVVAAEQALMDARAEAELRHAVGEYTVDEWDALARESDAALATAAADRIAAQLALDEIDRALADVRTEPAPAVAEAAGAGPTVPEPVMPEPVTAVPVTPELIAPEPAVAAPPPEPAALVVRPSVALPLGLEALFLPVEELEPIPTPSVAMPAVVSSRVEPAAPASSPPPPPAREDAEPPTVTASVERPAGPVQAIDDLFLAPFGDALGATDPAPSVPPTTSNEPAPSAPRTSSEPPPRRPSAPDASPRPSNRPAAGIRGTEAFDDLEFLKSLGRGSGAIPAGSSAPEPAPPGVPGPTPPVTRAHAQDVPATPPVPPAPPQAAPRRVTAPTTRPMTPPLGMTPPRGVTPPRPPVIPGPPPPPRISQQFAAPPEPIPPDPSVTSPEQKLFQSRMTDPGVDSIRAASFSAGSIRASGSSSAAKTLKCAECGAMNHPTEWYCERCGGELASL